MVVPLPAQRDFGASPCSDCGMVYTKGHEEDEKLHKAFHQGAVQGFKFQVCVHVCLSVSVNVPPQQPMAAAQLRTFTC